MSPADAHVVRAALRDVGYAPGYYSAEKGDIVPPEREDELLLKLYPDHIIHHTCLTGDHRTPALCVDFAFQLGWYTAGFREETDNILAQAISVNDLPLLPPIWALLDVILHLYREAWFVSVSGFDSDVRLLRFSDIAVLCETYCEHAVDGSIRRCAEAMGCVKNVAWVLRHTDETLGVGLSEFRKRPPNPTLRRLK